MACVMRSAKPPSKPMTTNCLVNVFGPNSAKEMHREILFTMFAISSTFRWDHYDMKHTNLFNSKAIGGVKMKHTKKPYSIYMKKNFSHYQRDTKSWLDDTYSCYFCLYIETCIIYHHWLANLFQNIPSVLYPLLLTRINFNPSMDM